MRVMGRLDQIYCDLGMIGMMGLPSGSNEIASDTTTAQMISVEDDFPGPCGACNSPKNPAVPPAHEEGLQVLCTPWPAKGGTTFWKGTSGVLKINGKRALHEGSTFKCIYGGTIKFVAPWATPGHVKVGK